MWCSMSSRARASSFQAALRKARKRATAVTECRADRGPSQRNNCRSKIVVRAAAADPRTAI